MENNIYLSLTKSEVEVVMSLLLEKVKDKNISDKKREKLTAAFYSLITSYLEEI